MSGCQVKHLDVGASIFIVMLNEVKHLDAIHEGILRLHSRYGVFGEMFHSVQHDIDPL